MKNSWYRVAYAVGVLCGAVGFWRASKITNPYWQGLIAGAVAGIVLGYVIALTEAYFTEQIATPGEGPNDGDRKG